MARKTTKTGSSRKSSGSKRGRKPARGKGALARRVLLLGLDGATFDLMQPWAEQGLLPCFKELLDTGARGLLRSAVPPTTPPAWATCITGLGPGSHGIYDFRASPLEDPNRGIVHSRHIKGEKLWQRLNAHGKRAAVINVPLTYPPEPLDGYMVTGMLTPGDEVDFTFPKQLRHQLLDRVPDYRINVDIPQYDTAFEEDAHAFLDIVKAMGRARGEAIRRFLVEEPCEFTFAVFVLPDRIQHLFWKHLDENDPLGRTPEGQRIRAAAIEAYQELDRQMAALLDTLSDDDLLMVVSDHGFGPTEAFFNVNHWLAEQDLLKLKTGSAVKKRLFFHAMDAGESKLVKGLLPRKLQREIRFRVRKTRSSTKDEFADALDRDATRALFVSVATQGIYIVGPGLAERERIRDRLAAELESLAGPDGRPLCDWVKPREEVYAGPRAMLAPDLLFQARDYAILGRHHLGARRLFDVATDLPIGFHRQHGILLARGPGVAAGATIEEAGLEDVAPTICAALGVPLAEQYEGRDLRADWGRKT